MSSWVTDASLVWMTACHLFDIIWSNHGLLLTSYVDAMPTSEVTLVTIWYIHPPHHGHTNVNIMVINGRLTSLSFHANRPIQSWDKAISNFKLQSQGHGCGQRERSYSQPSIVFASFIFHINQTNNFWDTAISKFDLEKSKVKVMSEVKDQGHIVYPVSIFLFVSHQSDQTFLRYQKSVWPCKNTSEIFKENSPENPKISPKSN